MKPLVAKSFGAAEGTYDAINKTSDESSGAESSSATNETIDPIE